MEIIRIKHSRLSETNFENLGFGEVFSDHMFSMKYEDGIWKSPQIIPFGKIEVLPSMCSFLPRTVSWE